MPDFQEEHESRGFDFHRYLVLARKFLWLLLLLPVVGGVAAWFYGQRLPDIYVAKATMLVEAQEQQYLEVEDFQTESVSNREMLNTVVESMRSRSILEEVAQSEAIADHPRFRNQGPEEIAGFIKHHLRVAMRPNTRLVDISVESDDPVLARDLAREVYASFLRTTMAQRAEAARLANQYLIDEEQRARAKLEASEQKLQEYKEKHDTAALSDRQNIIVSQLEEINSAATEAKNERLRLETDLQILQELGDARPEKILQVASVSQLPQVVAAQGQLASAEADFEVLKQRYLHKHPKYIAAKTKIDDLTRSLHEVARQSTTILSQKLDAAIQREQRLNDSLKDQERKALALDRIGIPYNVLAREVESDRTIYESVVARLKESGVSQTTTLPYRLIESPLIPESPSKPDRQKILITGIMAGLGLAIALIALSQAFDQTYRNVDDVERDLEASVLSAVFQVPGDTVSKSKGLVFAEDPNSEHAEPFRTLRASLSLLGDEAHRKVFMVTSAVPGEGKSFTSLNLAAAFAQQGHRTILIDADLRRPAIHKYLQIQSESGGVPAGLTECLSGHDQLDDLLIHPPDSDLGVLTAGTRSPTPAELLSGPRMAELLEVLQESYDRIVVDTPPINAVSDALLLAPRAHATCLVVRAGKTPKKAVQRAATLLRKSGGKFAGVILNCLKKDGNASYYYYYYGKQYADAGRES